ncbi:hypothetical protein DFH07DRAFT_771525 [Mycena maculata]|uniref:Uncharacterized protein n=1 Tax=Mycena maculata TaxID=230809 RepID=A0AAD7JBX7_9AGAR|nr:hypothetical protein DFH07DRAFT_771525 [Mycena maculata]
MPFTIYGVSPEETVDVGGYSLVFGDSRNQIRRMPVSRTGFAAPRIIHGQAGHVAEADRVRPPIPFPNRAKIVPVPLPPPPPTPVFPAPALTDVDLAMYIAPLIVNGWLIRRSTVTEDRALHRSLSLTCSHHFNDHTTARLFLSTIVAIIPTPTPGSLERVRVRLSTMNAPPRILIQSVSELAPGAP